MGELEEVVKLVEEVEAAEVVEAGEVELAGVEIVMEEEAKESVDLPLTGLIGHLSE